MSIGIAFMTLALSGAIPAATSARDDPGTCAGADEAADPDAHHLFHFNSGLGSAVGFGGPTYAWSPIRAVQFEFGTGYGMTGLQLSFMPKLTLGTRAHRAVIGAGTSLSWDVGSRWRGNESDATVLSWFNGEVGYEYRSAEGFSFLVAAGLTILIGGKARFLDSIIPLTGRYSPQGRIAIGHWF